MSLQLTNHIKDRIQNKLNLRDKELINNYSYNNRNILKVSPITKSLAQEKEMTRTDGS